MQMQYIDVCMCVHLFNKGREGGAKNEQKKKVSKRKVKGKKKEWERRREGKNEGKKSKGEARQWELTREGNKRN